jgi:hypothetical protein
MLVHVNDVLYDLVAAQHGLLTRAQALGAGLSPGQWSSITRSDDWAHMYPGVVRRLGAPETFELVLMGGCLYADAIASHRAAGMLWRLPGIEPALEVTIPRPRRVAMKRFEVHRTSFFKPMDLAHRSGIPVTSLPRTVIDISLEIPFLGPALTDHVAATRKVPLPLLIDRLEAQGLQGRKGAGDLMGLLKERPGRQRHVDSGLRAPAPDLGRLRGRQLSPPLDASRLGRRLRAQHRPLRRGMGHRSHHRDPGSGSGAPDYRHGSDHRCRRSPPTLIGGGAGGGWECIAHSRIPTSPWAYDSSRYLSSSQPVIWVS